jgi:hypothetical protein
MVLELAPITEVEDDMRNVKWFAAGLLLASLGVLAACNKSDSDPTTSAQPSAEGQKYLLGEEPAGAKDVHDARKDAKDSEQVVLVGRIGGAKDPWVADQATFTVVGKTPTACSDIPGDSCPTPWDFCCATGLAAHTAVVQVVDDQGQTVPVDARKLLGLKELQTVVVRGKAQRDQAGNLTVLASGVYVKR